MKRVVVWKKEDGVDFDNLEGLKVPVTFGFNLESPVGCADNFKIDDKGDLICNVDMKIDVELSGFGVTKSGDSLFSLAIIPSKEQIAEAILSGDDSGLIPRGVLGSD